MRKILSGLIGTILTVITVGFILLGAMNWFSAPKRPGLLGFKGYVVTSNSMQPAFSAGDYIVVKKEPFQNLEKEDIITFLDTETIVTHRLQEQTGRAWQTKGDANQATDQHLVVEEDYLGKMKVVFSGLGSLIIFLQRPAVFPVLLFLMGAYIIFLYRSDSKK